MTWICPEKRKKERAAQRPTTTILLNIVALVQFIVPGLKGSRGSKAPGAPKTLTLRMLGAREPRSNGNPICSLIFEHDLSKEHKIHECRKEESPPSPEQKSNKYGAPEKHEEVGDSSENSKASTVPATQSLIHDSSYHVIFFVRQCFILHIYKFFISRWFLFQNITRDFLPNLRMQNIFELQLLGGERKHYGNI